MTSLCLSDATEMTSTRGPRLDVIFPAGRVVFSFDFTMEYLIPLIEIIQFNCEIFNFTNFSVFLNKIHIKNDNKQFIYCKKIHNKLLQEDGQDSLVH